MFSTRRKRTRGRIIDDDDNENSTSSMGHESIHIVNLISDDDEPAIKRPTPTVIDIRPVVEQCESEGDLDIPKKKRRRKRKKKSKTSDDYDLVEDESKSKQRNKRSNKAANYSSLTEPSKRQKLRSPTRKRSKSLEQNAQINGADIELDMNDKVQVMEISDDGEDFVSSKPRKRRTISQLFSSCDVELNNDTSLGERIRSLDSKAIVMSSRKRGEIRQWLESAIDGSGSRLLILHGPPGCGKWSGLRSIFNEFKLNPVQWEPPIPPAKTSILGAMMDSLESFLVGANYVPLVGDSRRAIVLRDLPISLTDSRLRRERLQQILSRYAANVRVPSVLLLSDDAKGVARLLRLIGSDVTSVAKIVKIPPPSAIATRKALTRLTREEGLEANAKVIDKLAETANGDLRGALNAIHLGGACDIGKDGILDTYHAVSKVLNNKRLESGESKYDVEAVLDEARANPGAFIAFLHENYVDFVSELDDAANALDAVSDADCIMQWDSDAQQRGMLADCAASVATRAFIYHNQAPIRHGWRPIRGPASYAISMAAIEYAEHARRTLLVPGEVVTRTSLLETGPYTEKVRGIRSTKWSAGYGSRDADMAMVDAEVQARNAQNDVVRSQHTEFSGRSQEYQISQEIIATAADTSESDTIDTWESENE